MSRPRPTRHVVPAVITAALVLAGLLVALDDGRASRSLGPAGTGAVVLLVAGAGGIIWWLLRRDHGTAAEPGRSAGAGEAPQSTVARLEAELGVARRIIESLRKSEELYRTLVHASPNAIVILDPDGSVAFVSPRARVLFGYAATEPVEGRAMLDFLVPEQHELGRRNFERLLRDGTVSEVEYRLRRADGTVFPASVNAAVIRSVHNEITGAVLIVRDMAERNRREATLRASEERFRHVVESMSEVFWVFDRQFGQTTYVSPRFEAVWGRPVGAAAEARKMWEDSIHPEDRARAIRSVDEAEPRGGVETYRIIRPDGSIRWIRGRVFGIAQPDGRVDRVVGISSDITEEKMLERQLLQAQRLEAVGTLASGVAHDINNILSPMLIIPRLLRPSLGAADREMLDLMEENARRGADIVKQLLAFGRGADSHRAPLALVPLVKQMGSIMRETFPREISIRTEAGAALPNVPADATQIHQVLMNLCVNARDAMPGGGTLTIRLAECTFGLGAVLPHPDAHPGAYVVLTVEDTGKGIPPGIIDRIFDPFFTTKELGRGTGLGLSTVMGIVKGHQGFVTVRSTVGAGTAFEVYLPVSAAGERLKPERRSQVTANGGGELILLVDDEESVRITWRVLLEDHGYRVLVAGDGAEAMQVLRNQTGGVRLVVTDVMMPRTSGRALLEYLRGTLPAVPVIAATGLHEADAVEELRRLGAKEVLQKPCLPEELLTAVRRAVAR